MLSDAWRELRYHPGRVVATIIAIAISVAFMAASSTFLRTEQNAMGKQGQIQYSATDVIAEYDYSKGGGNMPTNEEVMAKIKEVNGVKEAEPTNNTYGTIVVGERAKQVMLFQVPGENFRWSKITDGRWAQKANEITLTKEMAKTLGVKAGDSVELDGKPATVVGITDDANSLLFEFGYLGPEAFNAGESRAFAYSINLADGANADQVINDLKGKLPAFKVQSSQAAADSFIKELSSGIDVFKYVLGVFQFIAIVVGMIIIFNTFTILITQRRRQIGLLRAVGASSGQVQRKFVAEALLLGVIGSLLGLALGVGLAALGSTFTKSIGFGIGLPWLDLAVAFIIGVVVTLLAAIVPILRTTQVSPLEALRPVLSADRQKKASIVRLVICLILAGIGVAMLVASQTLSHDSWPIAWALGAIFFLTIAILLGAPLYIPGLLRLSGKIIGPTGPTARLAAMNSARNPGRASATAVALMLAMGLIVALQVGTASVRSTVTEQIEESNPIDMVITSNEGEVSPRAQDIVSKLPNVAGKSTITGGRVDHENFGKLAIGAPDASAKEAAPGITLPKDDEILMEGGGKEITVKTMDGGTLTLKVRPTNGVGQVGIVTESTMKKLIKDPVTMGYWIKTKDRGEVGSMMQKLTPVMTDGQLSLGGSAPQANIMDTILNILLGVITALLGVAVLIALIGVANTLGLSVIERTRESALLRALGMQKSKLRLMLLIEAVLLALVGAVVGVLGGAAFAWLVLRSFFRQVQIPTSDLRFALDPVQTPILLLVAMVAGALASILPGRKAASASPTAALAED